MGYQVLTARAGREAIEVYKKHRDTVDLVLLDIIMPNMKGGEVFDRLKEINPEVKVLLSSGYSIDGEASKILERGCSGFIQKPFDMNQLSQSIGALLKKNSI
jgi:CheY-like chemotaxis protein